MRFLLINGSPHKNGTTSAPLAEFARILREEGAECETMQIGNLAIRGCTACMYCKKNGKCVICDTVNEAAERFNEADGLIVASPVYYASPNGSVISFLDRLFFSTPFEKTMKLGASLVCARRGGCTASFDVLNKYFAISGMPIIPSTYWNQVHGASSEEDALHDEEGMQTVRNLARNAVFLAKSIKLGKESFGYPEQERNFRTNFIKKS